MGTSRELPTYLFDLRRTVDVHYDMMWNRDWGLGKAERIYWLRTVSLVRLPTFFYSDIRDSRGEMTI